MIDEQPIVVHNAHTPLPKICTQNQAKHHGFGFKAREPGKVTVEIDGKDVDFKVLHVLEFTSDRKKSSVILRREDNSLVVRCWH